MQDLLDTTSDTYSDGYDSEREVVGLDMWVYRIIVSLCRFSNKYQEVLELAASTHCLDALKDRVGSLLQRVRFDNRKSVNAN